MHTKKELAVRMQEAAVNPLKKLGQNFLVNPKISERMIEKAKSLEPLEIIEIGPGLGALTDELNSLTSKLTLIELDSGLVRYWREKLPSAEIIHEDALRFDWQNFFSHRSNSSLNNHILLVSNLPYSIAASLVLELSTLQLQSSFLYLSRMILMFQKEVAQRIQAKPESEDYGMLSVVAQAFWQIEKLIDAGPQDFYPVPNVGSRVLTFTRKKIDLNGPGFLKFVKRAFSHRRKKLTSNLNEDSKTRNVKETLLAFLNAENLSDSARAENLSVEQFQKLFQLLSF